jgi:hypothetical protein
MDPGHFYGAKRYLHARANYLLESDNATACPDRRSDRQRAGHLVFKHDKSTTRSDLLRPRSISESDF